LRWPIKVLSGMELIKKKKTVLSVGYLPTDGSGYCLFNKLDFRVIY
jgi:hypothetical protein